MSGITFVTGNQAKADYLANYLGLPIKHRNIDLDEIQSLDLKEIVEHKAKQAYSLINTPVVVDDVALEFTALGKLPGPLIKWFMEELTFEAICSLLDGRERDAIARCVMGYYDGERLKLFEKSLKGSIAKQPVGENGFGWDKIFIPEGFTVTRAQLNVEDDKTTYKSIKPFAELKHFLETLK
jgi:non-canonical purine NTP pyrophosphatase (RdgB/HAM1 family)